jgi:hypothetical protein
VSRCAAAVADEHEVARVASALTRDAPQEVFHMRVHDLDDPRRRSLHVEAQWLGDTGSDRVLGKRSVKRRRAGEQALRAQFPEHEIPHP